MSALSTIFDQLTKYFMTHPLLAGVAKDEEARLLLIRLVRARVLLLMKPTGDWGGGGYTDIAQIPKERLERLVEEIFEHISG